MVAGVLARRARWRAGGRGFPRDGVYSFFVINAIAWPPPQPPELLAEEQASENYKRNAAAPCAAPRRGTSVV